MLRIPESIETETNIMADTGSRWSKMRKSFHPGPTTTDLPRANKLRRLSDPTVDFDTQTHEPVYGVIETQKRANKQMAESLAENYS